jgi:hypothetical protein
MNLSPKPCLLIAEKNVDILPKKQSQQTFVE